LRSTDRDFVRRTPRSVLADARSDDRNRQGNDVGPQYRSVIFYHNDEQKKAAASSKRKLDRRHLPRSIVTEIVPLTEFLRAEDYHQNYTRNTRIRDIAR